MSELLTNYQIALQIGPVCVKHKSDHAEPCGWFPWMNEMELPAGAQGFSQLGLAFCGPSPNLSPGGHVLWPLALPAPLTLPLPRTLTSQLPEEHRACRTPPCLPESHPPGIVSS